MADIEFAGELRRLGLKAGDVFVLTSREKIPLDAHGFIRSKWTEFWRGSGRDVPSLLILDSGLDLAAMSAPSSSTLESRAREIADLPGTADVYAVALRHLREAVDEALRRAGVAPWPTHGEMNG